MIYMRIVDVNVDVNDVYSNQCKITTCLMFNENVTPMQFRHYFLGINPVGNQWFLPKFSLLWPWYKNIELDYNPVSYEEMRKLWPIYILRFIRFNEIRLNIMLIDNKYKFTFQSQKTRHLTIYLFTCLL